MNYMNRNKKTVSLVMDSEIVEKLDRMAQKEDRDRSFMIRQAVNVFFKESEKDKK